MSCTRVFSALLSGEGGTGTFQRAGFCVLCCLLDSQGPQQAGRPQQFSPLDHSNSDGTAAYGPHVPSQPLLQHRPAALQVYYLSSCIRVQVQHPKATLSVHQSSLFPGVDAAGGRKAAGLYPGRAAVKVPARHTRFSPGEEACLQTRTHARTHAPLRTYEGACTYMCTHTQDTQFLVSHAYTPLYLRTGGGHRVGCLSWQARKCSVKWLKKRR